MIIRTDDEYVFEMYYPEEGHSFIEINGEWVDLTDRETLAEVEEYSQLSDPAINILYV